MNEKLLNWRKGVGLTQAEAAQRLGISSKSYWRYENGIREIPEEILEMLQDRKMPTKKQEAKQTIAAREHRAEQAEKRLCSFKKKSVTHPNGDVTQWFLPCMGSRCMSYQDGRCVRVQ